MEITPLVRAMNDALARLFSQSWCYKSAPAAQTARRRWSREIFAAKPAKGIKLLSNSANRGSKIPAVDDAEK
jgi:hypothetical protein